MDIRFLQPLWLLLLIAIPLLWIFPRRVDDSLQGILRSLLVVLLGVALARPVWLESDERTYHVFIIDHSASVPAAKRGATDAALQALRDQAPAHDPVSIISIGGDGEADARLVGPSASSLGDAMRAALTRIPEGSRGEVTLLSDGEATDSDWGAALQAFSVRGIAVNTVDVGGRKGDLYPSGLQTESMLRSGQTVHAVIDVTGEGNGFTVRLKGPRGELGRSGPLLSHGHISVPIDFEAPASGFLPVNAEVLPDGSADSDRRNNSLTRVLAIQDSLRLLYVGDRQRGGAAQLARLLGRGFEVTDVAERTLDEKFPLDDYELVLIDDRPASALPVAFQQHLVEEVRERGLGLLFAGGRASFGTGGYYNTPVSQALPVAIAQREEQRDPSVSLAIILDTSASMTGPPLELAKQVAQLTIHRLTADDQVGIVEFYGAKQWAVPLQSAANRLEIDRAIGRMQAGGSTVLYPGIEEAYYGLKNMHTRHKHIVVITDAGVEDADFESLVRRLSKDGINLSSVLVGDGRYDEIMFNLAAWGKGRYYAVGDRYALVELIFKQLSMRQLPSYRTGLFPLVSRGGAGWWGNTDRSALPPLDAYVELDARPRAEVLIEPAGRSQPVLATWHYGLGRVTALMTEPLGAGTRPWQRWADYGTMLGRLISRTASDAQVMRYELTREAMSVTLTARRESADLHVRPAAVLERDGTSLPFRERAPGLFEARVPVAPDEEIRIVAGLEGSAHRAPARLVSTVSDFSAAESQVDPRSGLDLARLARLTGGRTLAAGDALPKGDPSTRSLAAVPLWPWCALCALLLYLTEIFHRRRSGP